MFQGGVGVGVLFCYLGSRHSPCVQHVRITMPFIFRDSVETRLSYKAKLVTSSIWG